MSSKNDKFKQEIRTKTGRTFTVDRTLKLQNIPLRTEEGKALREAFQSAPVLDDANFADDDNFAAVEALLRKFREDHEAIRKDLGLEEQAKEACQHSKCLPEYDPVEAAKIGDSWEIKKRFPRFFGQCPDCGAQVIMYASYEHYVMGDW